MVDLAIGPVVISCGGSAPNGRVNGLEGSAIEPVHGIRSAIGTR